MTRVRGAALLLVLWLIALLAALVGGYAMTARIEYLQGRVLSQGLVARAASRAGIEYALVRVGEDDPLRRWLADGRPYHWQFGGAQVEVKLVDEEGKVDLNAADFALLSSLFRVLGADPRQADRIAGAVVDWRDPDPLTQPSGGAEDVDYEAAGRPYGAKDGNFETLAELQAVLGMTPGLYARAAPHLTVYTGRGTPDTTFASAQVLSAMGLEGDAMVARRRAWDPARGVLSQGQIGAEALLGQGSGTYSIESRARLRDGRSALLRVVVRSGQTGLPGTAYLPLQWEEGTSLR